MSSATEGEPAAEPVAVVAAVPEVSSSEPNWIVDGIRHVRDELVLFGSTAAAVTLHPARFAEAWANGTRRALNPLAFLATAVGFTWPMKVLGDVLMQQRQEGQSIWLDLWQHLA